MGRHNVYLDSDTEALLAQYPEISLSKLVQRGIRLALEMLADKLVGGGFITTPPPAEPDPIEKREVIYRAFEMPPAEPLPIVSTSSLPESEPEVIHEKTPAKAPKPLPKPLPKPRKPRPTKTKVKARVGRAVVRATPAAVIEHEVRRLDQIDNDGEHFNIEHVCEVFGIPEQDLRDDLDQDDIVDNDYTTRMGVRCALAVAARHDIDTRKFEAWLDQV